MRRTFDKKSVKTGRTFYTEQKIACMERNIESRSWAQDKKKRAIEAAERYLAYGVENLSVFVTQQNLPRSYAVNQIKGCPVCETGVNKYGNYPYEADPLGQPFKLTCPNCKSVFPSNDFFAYYKSGLDEHGFFDAARADRRHLVNTLYKDKPDDWCTDDGFGWIDQDRQKKDEQTGASVPGVSVEGANRYTFIAYYNHWFIWMHGFGSKFESGAVTSAIVAFADAYLYTGKRKYAIAGLVLLNRVADAYPAFDAGVYKWKDNFRHSGGDHGKIIGSIWEETLVDAFVTAYDAFFPAIDDDAAHKISSFPHYKNAPLSPDSGTTVKQNIENNILYQVLPEVINRRIRGNVGMHQTSIALAALVLQNPEYFSHCIDFILSTTDDIAWGSGNIRRVMIDHVDHDGCGDETSIGYNGIWLNGINRIADVLKGKPQDLYRDIRFKKMFDLDIPYIIADGHTLNIGDAGRAADPFLNVHDGAQLSNYIQNESIKSAQLLALSSANREDEGSIARHMQDMFQDWNTIEHKLRKTIEQHGPFVSKSANYSGYGLAKIENRQANEPKSMWMYYGRNTGHGHRDTLMLGFYAYGIYLNPDHGYPCYADSNHERRCWTVNTISHDTVSVDHAPGKNHIVGIPHHFDAKGPIGVIDVEAPGVYPQTDVYRRTTVAVSLDSQFYAVDFFTVEGGNDHKYVLHGAPGTVKTTGLQPTLRTKGTYAGEDVPFADEKYDRNHSDGYNYLYDAQIQTGPVSNFTVDWKLEDTWGVWDRVRDVHLAATVLSSCDEVALAKGQPPQNKPGNPKEYTYALLCNKGDNRKSQFVSVIEPYENECMIKSVQTLSMTDENGAPADVTAYALKVIFKNGREDIIIRSIDNKTYTVDGHITCKGFLTVLSYKNGSLLFQYQNDTEQVILDGQHIMDDPLHIRGTVLDFTKTLSAQNEIRVKTNRNIEPQQLIGAYIDIETDGVRNGFYEIVSAQRDNDCEYRLHTGDISFIRGYVDARNMDQGYLYNIQEGARFRIPLTKTN